MYPENAHISSGSAVIGLTRGLFLDRLPAGPELRKSCPLPPADDDALVAPEVLEAQESTLEHWVCENATAADRYQPLSWDQKADVPDLSTGMGSSFMVVVQDKPASTLVDLSDTVVGQGMGAGAATAQGAESAKATLNEGSVVREILSIAVPALGVVLADPLMGLVDTACVGQVRAPTLPLAPLCTWPAPQCTFTSRQSCACTPVPRSLQALRGEFSAVFSTGQTAVVFH